MRLTNSDLHKIREAAIEIYKTRLFEDISPECQMTASVLIAFSNYLDSKRTANESEAPVVKNVIIMGRYYGQK